MTERAVSSKHHVSLPGFSFAEITGPREPSAFSVFYTRQEHPKAKSYHASHAQHSTISISMPWTTSGRALMKLRKPP